MTPAPRHVLCPLAVALALWGCIARTEVSWRGEDAGARPSTDCAAPLARCGGLCVDTRSDSSHCGACGRACLDGQSCVTGACQCPPGESNCGRRCVDTRTDRTNCGECGRVCDVEQSCNGGACVLCAEESLTLCNAPGDGGVAPDAAPRGDPYCADLRSSAANCGACGRACASVNGMAACVAGACVFTCNEGYGDCDTDPANGCETDTRISASNCGACGRACAAGQRCERGACAAAPMTGPELRIEALTTEGCVVIEHGAVTGDHGGIALGDGEVYYSGSTATARFDADTLATRGTFPRLAGIFGETTTAEVAFTLTTRVGRADDRRWVISSVLRVTPDGAFGSPPIRLSQAIVLDRPTTGPSGIGIFGGLQRAVVTQGSRAWVLTGEPVVGTPVTEIAIAPVGPHSLCTNGQFWGVAEYFDGAPWVAYVRDPRTVVRHNLVTGEVRTVATFTDLSDMCSIAASPTRNRWYFHHQGASQFRAGDQTLGRCNARFISGTP